jgi:hypothetical protein
VQYGLISADNTSFPFATFAAANTVAVVDDSASAGVHYPLFVDGTAGQEAPKTSTTKLKYTPSTGRLEATQLKGDGSQLTAIPSDQLTGNVAQARIAAAVNAPGAAPIFSCRAFGVFNPVPDVFASGNVAGITRNGTGDFTVNFSTALASNFYHVSTQSSNAVFIETTSLTATSFRIRVLAANSAGSIGTVPTDVALLSFSVIL